MRTKTRNMDEGLSGSFKGKGEEVGLVKNIPIGGVSISGWMTGMG